MKIENTGIKSGGNFTTATNKSYLGYAAKPTNVTKLAKYLADKSAFKGANNASKALGKKNDILKNKRF